MEQVEPTRYEGIPYAYIAAIVTDEVEIDPRRCLDGDHHELGPVTWREFMVLLPDDAPEWSRQCSRCGAIALVGDDTLTQDEMLKLVAWLEGRR